MLEQEKEKEISLRPNIWASTDQESNFNFPQKQNQIQIQKDLKLLCLKIDLQILKEKGFQNPKTPIYIFATCSVLSLSIITFIFGYSSNWDKLAFFPILLGWIGILLILGNELIESHEISKSRIQKLRIVIAKLLLGLCYSFSVIYAAIFNVPFGNAIIYLMSICSNICICCFMICFCRNYDELPNELLSKNNDDENIGDRSFEVARSYVANNTQIQILSHEASFRYPLQNSQLHLFSKFQKYEVDGWRIYKQRLWTSFVTSVMYIDVVSDLYYAYRLFHAYGALSAFLRISGIALTACCAVDLGMVLFLLVFPGWVNYSVHAVAFVMEIPNFVLTGLAIWKMQQLINQNLVENFDGQQVAIFSMVTTLLNALVHIMYIVDSWTILSAIEFFQEQGSE